MNKLTREQSVTTEAPINRGRSLGLILGVALILALVALFSWKLSDGARGQVDSDLAPDFTLSLFDGGQLTLSDLQGEVVVVNFWASWCVPCRAEAPVLERAWQPATGAWSSSASLTWMLIVE